MTTIIKYLVKSIVIGVSVVSLSACKNIGGNGEAAEKAKLGEYTDGLYANLQKRFPLPDIKSYQRNGGFDEIGYLGEQVKVKEVWADRSAKSCEASKAILSAYMKDYFASEKIKYWTDNQNCVMASELMRQLISARSEFSERSSYHNRELSRTINSIESGLIELGLH